MGCGASQVAAPANSQESGPSEDVSGAPHAVAERDACATNGTEPFGVVERAPIERGPDGFPINPGEKPGAPQKVIVQRVAPKKKETPTKPLPKVVALEEDFESDSEARNAVQNGSTKVPTRGDEFGYQLDAHDALPPVAGEQARKGSGREAQAFGRDLGWLEADDAMQEPSSSGIVAEYDDAEHPQRLQPQQPQRHGGAAPLGQTGEFPTSFQAPQSSFRAVSQEQKPPNPLAAPSPHEGEFGRIEPLGKSAVDVGSPMPRSSKFEDIQQHSVSPPQQAGGYVPPPINPNDPWAGLQSEYRIPGTMGNSFGDPPETPQLPPIAPQGARGRGANGAIHEDSTPQELVLDDEPGEDAEFDMLMKQNQAKMNKAKKKKPAALGAEKSQGNWGDGELAAPGTLMVGQDTAVVAMGADDDVDDDDDDALYEAGAGGDGLEDGDLEAPPADDLAMDDVDDFDAEMEAMNDAGMNKDLAAKLRQFETDNY